MHIEMILLVEWNERFTEIISAKAKEVCKSRIISFLEGGYDLDALSDSVEAHVAVLRS